MENLSKSIIKRIELIINTTDLTNPNEILKLAIEQENKKKRNLKVQSIPLVFFINI